MNKIENIQSELHALELKLKAAKNPIERSYLTGLMASMDSQIKLLSKWAM